MVCAKRISLAAMAVVKNTFIEIPVLHEAPRGLHRVRSDSKLEVHVHTLPSAFPYEHKMQDLGQIAQAKDSLSESADVNEKNEEECFSEGSCVRGPRMELALSRLLPHPVTQSLSNLSGSTCSTLANCDDYDGVMHSDRSSSLFEDSEEETDWDMQTGTFPLFAAPWDLYNMNADSGMYLDPFVRDWDTGAMQRVAWCCASCGTAGTTDTLCFCGMADPLCFCSGTFEEGGVYFGAY